MVDLEARPGPAGPASAATSGTPTAQTSRGVHTRHNAGSTLVT
ncbi:hypothetical protein HMPREF1136_0941 [Actinomyces sp. ICM47]|nr:hypothetical protein HMPREF1136_0941 [Actinomyces sp. ICM47]